MQRSSFTNRFLIPVFLALAVMIASRTVYGNAHRIEDKALYHAVAVLAGTVQFASIVLAAVVLYPIAYFRGAAVGERVIAGTTNLAVWVGIDAYHVSQAFSFAESIYLGVNVGSILLSWSLALMGILELACRWISRRRGGPGGGPMRILTPGPFVPILVFLFVVCILSKEGGAYYFNSMLDGYAALFRR